MIQFNSGYSDQRNSMAGQWENVSWAQDQILLLHGVLHPWELNWYYPPTGGVVPIETVMSELL